MRYFKAQASIALLFLLAAGSLQATPKVEWRQNFASDHRRNSNREGRFFWTENIIPTRDDGALLIGQYIVSSRDSATAALKLDSQGNIEWFADPMKPRGKTLKRGMNGFQHSNGDYILTGTYEMSGGYWVACLSSEGKVKWDTTHRWEGFSYSLIEGLNGEIVAANDTATGLRIRKYQPGGRIVFSHIYPPVRNKPFEWHQNLSMANERLSMICTRNGVPQYCSFLPFLESTPIDMDPSNNERFSLVRLSDGGALFMDGEEGYDFVKDEPWSFSLIKRWESPGVLRYEKHIMLGDRGNILMKGAFDRPDRSLVLFGTADNGPQEYFFAILDPNGDTLMAAFYPTEMSSEFLMKATRARDGGVFFMGSNRISGVTWVIKTAPLPVMETINRSFTEKMKLKIKGKDTDPAYKLLE